MAFYTWEDMKQWKELEIFEKNFFPDRKALTDWWNQYVGCRMESEITYNYYRFNRLFKYFTEGE